MALVDSANTDILGMMGTVGDPASAGAAQAAMVNPPSVPNTGAGAGGFSSFLSGLGSMGGSAPVGSANANSGVGSGGLFSGTPGFNMNANAGSGSAGILGIGNIAQDIIGAFFQDTPKMPPAPQVNATQQQGLAIQGNLQNLAADEALTGRTNSFMSDQVQQMLEKAIPGYKNILGQQSSVLQSELAGNIPQDVQQQIQQAAAGQANYGGFGQSGMKQNLTARDLGLTSLGITNQALSTADQWMSTIAAMALPHMMDLSSMFITPEQEIQNAWQNQISSFQRNWANNVMQTQASNAQTRAIGSLATDTITTAANVAMMA